MYPPRKPSTSADAVAVVQFEEERANYVVEARTQTAARHDAGARLLRIEEQLRPRPRQLELDPGSAPTSIRSGMRTVITGRVTF